MMPIHTAPRLAAVILLVLGLGHTARAQPAGPPADDHANAAEAARLYDEGKRHYDIGEYAQAIASWKQSYLRSSAPLLLFNIAQAYRLSNNCAQANRFYLNYRRSEPHPNNQVELDKAMAKCAGIEPATGDAATSEPATTPAVDAPRAPAPSERSATPPGAPSEGARRTDQAAQIHQASAPTDQAASDRGHGLVTAGYVTGGAGAAALLLSGIFAIQARQDSNTVSGAQAGTPFNGDVASDDHSGRTAASRAKVFAGIGAALAVAGGAMWYVGHRQGHPQVDIAIVPGHTEVTFSCAF